MYSFFFLFLATVHSQFQRYWLPACNSCSCAVFLADWPQHWHWMVPCIHRLYIQMCALCLASYSALRLWLKSQEACEKQVLRLHTALSVLCLLVPFTASKDASWHSTFTLQTAQDFLDWFAASFEILRVSTSSVCCLALASRVLKCCIICLPDLFKQLLHTYRSGKHRSTASACEGQPKCLC